MISKCESLSSFAHLSTHQCPLGWGQMVAPLAACQIAKAFSSQFSGRRPVNNSCKLRGSVQRIVKSARRATAAPTLHCAALLTSSSDEVMPDSVRHHPVLDRINNSTKWSVSAAALGTLLLRRDVTACWCLTGSVVAAFNCRLLKYAINESRPEAARKADPGMPSSHANSLAFLSTFVSLASTAAMGWQSPYGVALAFGIPTAAIFLAWLRVALGYHTMAQVVVGWLVGSASAAWWWRLGQNQLLPALQQHPEWTWGLYGMTCLAVAFFVVQNVLRWVRERGAHS